MEWSRTYYTHFTKAQLTQLLQHLHLLQHTIEEYYTDLSKLLAPPQHKPDKQSKQSTEQHTQSQIQQLEQLQTLMNKLKLSFLHVSYDLCHITETSHH